MFPLSEGGSIVEPPKAKEIEHRLVQEFGDFKDERNDEYYWLRSDSREDEAVLEHLKKENDYTDQVFLKDSEGLRKELYEEMKNRIKEDDIDPAYRKGDYLYYSRISQGMQYHVHCRQTVKDIESKPSIHDDLSNANGVEEVLLDENTRASDVQSYSLADFNISPDYNFLCFAEDLTGSEKYNMYVKEIKTDRIQQIEIDGECSGDILWGRDNTVLYYLTKDELDRPFKLYKCELELSEKPGEVFTQAKHTLIRHEEDDQFYMSLWRSSSDQVVYLSCDSAITSEVSYISLKDKEAELKVLFERKQAVEYSATDNDGKYFFVISNENALNSKLLVHSLEHNTTEELLHHREDVKLENVRAFKNHLVVVERFEGLRRLRVYSLNKPDNIRNVNGDFCDLKSSFLTFYALDQVSFPDEAYLLRGVSGNYESTVLRFGYSSLSVPSTTYDYDFIDGERSIKKIQEVLGSFDTKNYLTKRTWATAEDGTKIPISYCYHIHNTTLPAQLYLDGYGSYEFCNEAGFSSTYLSLMDRGIVFAIAHVRGGGEMGRKWYEDGKFLKKHNTWRDFLSCSKHMVSEGIGKEGDIVCEGASAGGLLIGATLNECPENMFAGAVSRVGFVDVLTTMSDPTIPLTAIEWEEWGNPTETKEFYDYIKGYSPYDQLEQFYKKPQPSGDNALLPIKKNFPPILATAGLNDPRVGFWEPAKWVQRLRKADVNSGRNILYRCLMESGHFAKSGRYSRLEEISLIFAFTLRCFKRK